MSIELNNVSYVAGAQTILRDLSLAIPTGQRCVIAGPNGSGKSSLLRLIAGLSLPSAGHINLSGALVSGPGSIVVPPARRKVAMIFQDLGLWPHLKVRQHISLPLKYMNNKGEDTSVNLESILSDCDLLSLANRSVAHLSGGEQQRVALARALAARPDYILLDEPFTALDVIQRRKAIQTLIEILKGRHITMVFVAHNFADVADLEPDRFCFLEGCKLSADIKDIKTFERIDNCFAKQWAKYK